MDPQDAKTPSKGALRIQHVSKHKKKHRFRKSSKNVLNMWFWRICTLLWIAKLRSQTPPWSLQMRCPVFRDPPQALQKPTLELPGPPQDTPESPQGPLRTSQIFKVDHQKPSQICVFGPQERQKNTFFQFLGVSCPPWDAPWSAPLLFIFGKG